MNIEFPVVNPNPERLDIARRLLQRGRSVDGGCIEWNGGVTQTGYCLMYVKIDGKPKNISVHRISYDLFVATIPRRFDVHHKCENRRCFNPDHLQAMSRRDHVLISRTQMAENAKKTHCEHGHEFKIETTYIDRRGRRHCKVCKAIRAGYPEYRPREKKAACARGHEFTPENTGNSKGWRYCLRCKRERRLEARYREKAAALVTKTPILEAGR